ncbi:helix-turn-helix domain-containing protein [Staphylococcus aureus]|uniref:helix-turn-helix domain-containing protein n=1 Tax=Staphylococcus aureus TaxID=1280 RepID=UPI00091A9AED|nr:helix-turn-helix transcriptional regulator [Staphylococcus aureus]MBO8737726.1 helix-turn-helix transcriptional regulator [Staphylococcus aureus]MCR0727722.1 helix-turn-helix domain-containing protein [Staphylococcus aureus]MCS5302898.1 helix-turn-helix domain-containing protein [Staphylococcus aureus]MDA5644065.1 helix-turn-helix transcriptional regulator [Staphylococcus aureus]MDP4298665.1 helix-turn-helix transcriptional regulator [Staphylococcus aureus]
MKLGTKIKNHRLNKGMNMREYGEFIDNTSDSIVSRWERNVSIPNPKRLKLIADDMDVTVTELLGSDNDD